MTSALPRLDTDSAPNPAPRLLLCGDARWQAATDAELAALGREDALVVADSPPDTVARLALAPQRFSHLLVQPDIAGDMLGDMVGLVGRRCGALPLLVLLGRRAAGLAVQPAATVDDAPRPGWLAPALAWRSPDRATQGPLIGESVVRELLAAGAVRALYQPMVWLADRRPGGMETLARLEHPQLGRLLPAQFLPAVESGRLLPKLTRAMVARAFADWRPEQLRELGMGIGLNLPLDVMLLPGLADWLGARCAEAQLTPFNIVLELTETQPVLDVPALGAVVAELRQRGYRVSIDDVGPGQRDPTALLRLPFTSVKLDMALVRHAADSAEARGYLRRLADTAHAAGMIVVAEGIEEQDTWQRMQRLGADAGQGYAIARPMPAAAVPLWHRAWTHGHPLRA
ncbi:MAG TPA: EAL domain-containing protein [Acetobacteraceae bacterium]|jgi:EAL domain-containing protein (putative c-di-GMP-specific phosphodiesterase class I)|nr:EAL domain-containing protein [Acetobacteraceae bacterium]